MQNPLIQLIPHAPEYFELWAKWRSEATTRRYNPILDRSTAELREIFSKVGSSLADLRSAEEFRYFVAFEKLLVGNVSLKSISHNMQFGEIGYGLSEEFHGKGLGTAAVREWVRKIFNETSLRRLVAYVAEENVPSCKLLERIGFVREGVLREHYLINGKPTNEVVYGILRSEWSPTST